MRTGSFVLFCTIFSAAFAQGQFIKPDSEFRVKLLAPLSTDKNEAGDKISAQVTLPQEFAGAYMEGKVKESKSGGKMNGKSVLNFSFNNLVYGGSPMPVAADVKSFFNSKGEQGVDEEGRVIKKSNNLTKALVGTGIGALIGGLAGGGKGAAAGAAVGAAATIIFVQVATTGPRVAFDSGSEFVLTVNDARKPAGEQ